MVGESWSIEKDLRLIVRVPKMKGGITKRTIREFKLECEEWKGETEVVGGASFTSRFDTDKIMQIDWFSFKEEIVSNRYDFVLFALFNL